MEAWHPRVTIAVTPLCPTTGDIITALNILVLTAAMGFITIFIEALITIILIGTAAIVAVVPVAFILVARGITRIVVPLFTVVPINPKEGEIWQRWHNSTVGRCDAKISGNA